ncbi:hypothetical protein H8E07_16645 [bacterium]|nr:hypothetical protein [bacterium]
MIRTYSCAALALLTITAPATAHATDVFVLGELPVLRTPMARYSDSNSKENVPVPVTVGGRVSFTFEGKRKSNIFTGLTLRGGVTGTGDRLLQFRYDSGFRRMLQPRERTQPFLELGFGFEAVQVRHHTDGLADMGAGPTLGVGWLVGDQRSTVVGARITAAFMSGGYSYDSDDFENDTWYSVTYSPSNVTLAVTTGRVF